jgi:hypothetical protein
VGESLEAEVKQLISRGLWNSFPQLEHLRQWQPYTTNGAKDDLTQGTRAMALALKSALEAWEKIEPHDAAAMAELLSLDNLRAKRVLTGNNGLRAKAGAIYGVQHDQFARVHEKPLITGFAAFIESWTINLEHASQDATQLDFGDLEKASINLHRKLEQQFVPDLVVTMSGPGSFAACYMMQYNTRDIPVLMAVTFPKRPHKTDVEQLFARAAVKADAVHLTTSKWSVYLPGLLRHLEKGTRVALVDDRVVSGATQIEARRQLEEFGLQVACSALFTSGSTPIDDLIVGRMIKGPFNMPWGTQRGRT